MVKEAADIHGDRVSMRTTYHAANGFLDDHVRNSRGLYRRRRDAMVAALEEYMPPGVTWSHPDGGFFIWITLPEELVADELLEFASSQGAAFLPGALFYPRGHELRNALRLSFSNISEERIRTGVSRLGPALQSYIGR